MASLAAIAYIDVLGFPLIFWLGIGTYVLLLVTVALITVGKRRPWRFRWHRRLGYAHLLMATIHGLLAIAAYV